MGTGMIIAIVIAIVIVIVIIAVSVYYGTRTEEPAPEVVIPTEEKKTPTIPPGGIPVTSNSGKTYYFYPTMQAPGGKRITYPKANGKKHIKQLMAKCESKPACTGISTRDPNPFVYVSKLPAREKWVQSWPEDQQMGIYTTELY